MSNFSDKENLEAFEENIDLALGDEESTIFSDPASHKDVARKKQKRKLLPKIIASFLTVAVLIGGTIGIIELIPEKIKNINPFQSNEKIPVLILLQNQLQDMVVTNSTGTYNLYTITSEVDSALAEKNPEEPEKVEVTYWYMEGFSSEVISSLSIEARVASLCQINAKQKIDAMSITDCGLDNPTITALITAKTGEKYKILVGKDSLDATNPGCYVMIEGKDEIYLADKELRTNFEFVPKDFAIVNDMISFPKTDDIAKDYFNEEGLLASFDTLTIKGENFSEPIVMVPTKNGKLSEYIALTIISPAPRMAQNADAIFELFKNGLSPSATYALDVSDSTLQELGLTEPDFMATMKIGSHTLTYKFALQNDGNYAAICDGEKIVKSVSADNLEFITQKMEDYYSKWICLNNIYETETFTIKTPNTDYVFNIENIDSEENEEDLKVTYNGYVLDTQSFKDFYQEVISVVCTDFEPGTALGSSEYSFIFDFREDIGGENRIDFYKVSDTRYQYRFDGKPMGKVNTSNLKKIISACESFVSPFSNGS